MEDQELKNQISRIVDSWVSDVLKDRFLQRPQNAQTRSLWDKFKQGFTNWWWGPKGEKHNPYRWQNRFGDELGVAESFNPSVFTLNEYKDIKCLVDSVENRLAESQDDFDKLRLMQVIRSAAERLKEMLFNALKGRVSGSSVSAPSQPSDPPQKRATSIVADPKASSAPETQSNVPPSSEPENTPDVGSVVRSSVGAVAKMKSEGTLRPDDSWFEAGKIKKEKILHLVAWMSLKTHVGNPLSADKTVEELSRAFPERKIRLGIPGRGDGRIESYLRSVLGDKYEKTISKLGIETKAEKQEPNERRERKPSVTANNSASTPASTSTISNKEADSKDSASEVKSDNSEEIKSPESSNDKSSSSRLASDTSNPELEGYVEKSQEKMISFLKALGGELANDVNDKQGSDKKSALFSWWREESKNLKSLSSFRDRLVVSDDYLSSISKAVGISKEEIKKMMVDNLQGKGLNYSRETSDVEKDKKEEEDTSLGIEAYLYDGDKPIEPQMAIERIEGFIKNPFKALGVKLDDERASLLNKWWEAEKESISKKSDKMGHLHNMMMKPGEDSYIKKIAELMGKSESFVEGLMKKHIRNKTNR